MVFIGTYEHTIDSKNRLAIPSEVRAQIRRSAPGGKAEKTEKGESIVLYLTFGTDGALCLYTEQGYEKRANELDHSERDADEVLEYEKLFYAHSKYVELDKQGRVTLPADMLEMSGLGSEVVLIGAKDHLEVHDRKTWREFVLRKFKEKGKPGNPRSQMRARRQTDESTNG